MGRQIIPLSKFITTNLLLFDWPNCIKLCLTVSWSIMSMAQISTISVEEPSGTHKTEQNNRQIDVADRYDDVYWSFFRIITILGLFAFFECPIFLIPRHNTIFSWVLVRGLHMDCVFFTGFSHKSIVELFCIYPEQNIDIYSTHLEDNNMEYFELFHHTLDLLLYLGIIPWEKSPNAIFRPYCIASLDCTFVWDMDPISCWITFGRRI